MKKTIARLANSIRTGGNHCVAGRELIQRDGNWSWGPWIRPVSKRGGGELPTRDCICSDNRLVEVLDIAEGTFGERQSHEYQPENHFIVPSARWRRIKTMRYSSLPLIVEEPEHLWWQADERSDRIHRDYAVASVSPFQSLYLIRPAGLRFRIWQTDEEVHGKLRKHRRAVFTYRDREYDLPITDPAVDKRYFASFPAPGQPRKETAPRDGADCLLVVSLAAPYKDGYHYKVVATVLETEL